MWESVLSVPGWGNDILYTQCFPHPLLCSMHLPGTDKQVPGPARSPHIFRASAKGKGSTLPLPVPASPLLREGEQSGVLMPAFISSSVSGNQTRGEPGAGASPHLRPRHAWVMWGHHIREPLPAGSWQGVAGSLGSADVPGILGSSAGFLRGTSGLGVVALDVALIGPWQTLCVTNLRQMGPGHSAGHSRHRRGHPLTVRLGKLRHSSQMAPFPSLPLLSTQPQLRLQVPRNCCVLAKLWVGYGAEG